MAKIAVFNGPRDTTIMTRTAVLAIDNLYHVNLIAACFEREAEIAVTHLAAETHAVKPMREYYRAHTGFIRVFVQYDVTILGFGRLGQRVRHDRKAHEDNWHYEG